MDENNRKSVDESWKETVKKEKTAAEENAEQFYEPSFLVFLSSLSMQAMIAMGKLENPVTGKTEVSRDQARYLIDTLNILKEKTKGNLTPEENKFLEESLFNLRMSYIDLGGAIE